MFVFLRVCVCVFGEEQNNNEVVFKIRKHTRLQKLMDAYCQRQSLNRGSVRFLFDGNRVNDDDTPRTLEMEDGDVIDVLVEQTGGRLLC